LAHLEKHGNFWRLFLNFLVFCSGLQNNMK
jgi:hypothetical protein